MKTWIIQVKRCEVLVRYRKQRLLERLSWCARSEGCSLRERHDDFSYILLLTITITQDTLTGFIGFNSSLEEGSNGLVA